MTTAATDQLTESIQELKSVAASALSCETTQALTDLEKFVSDIEAYARETQQMMWGDQAKSAIKNLSKDAPLLESDKDAIKAFLVSDAERYVKLENNYGEWKRELTRLTEDLVQRANVVDRESVADMRGVLKDVMQLLPNIRNFVEEKQRAVKLNNALENLDQPSRAMLAKLLTEQLGSTDR